MRCSLRSLSTCLGRSREPRAGVGAIATRSQNQGSSAEGSKGEQLDVVLVEHGPQTVRAAPTLLFELVLHP